VFAIKKKSRKTTFIDEIIALIYNLVHFSPGMYLQKQFLPEKTSREDQGKQAAKTGEETPPFFRI